MNLKPTLLAGALALACGSLAAPVVAGIPGGLTSPQGTITISGSIIGDTCSITFGGAGVATGTTGTGPTGAAGTVTLPTVTTQAFGAAGSVAGNTPFSIKLAGCNAALTTAQTLWSSSSNINTDGNLKNTAAGGSNVEVQLLDANGGGATAMNLSKGTAAGQGSNAVNFSTGASAGQATLNYQAQYYATAATTTAGAVTTTVNFVINYQ